MNPARRTWRKLVDEANACVRGEDRTLALTLGMRALRGAPPLLTPGDVRAAIPDALVRAAKTFVAMGPEGRALMAPLLEGAAASMDRLLTATLAPPRWRADIDG